LDAATRPFVAPELPFVASPIDRAQAEPLALVPAKGETMRAAWTTAAAIAVTRIVMTTRSGRTVVRVRNKKLCERKGQ
jgi:hypothetical protein